MQTEQVVPTLCKSNSKINELVKRSAKNLSNGQAVCILGRSATITKAISVTEIIKRAFEEAEENID